MRPSLDGARILILGGTGSLGQRLCRHFLSDQFGAVGTVTVFSRDEAKQHYMRLDFLNTFGGTDDLIYRDSAKRLQFVIGDVRNLSDLRRAVSRADLVIHSAALKQVPTCEYFAGAAVDTNVYGAINLSRVVREAGKGPAVVIGVSTDKACKPVNLMGMTKAIQERVLIQANLDTPETDFVNVRYGNVMASRGSAIPFFLDLAAQRRPIPITDVRMTRFMMTLDEAVGLIVQAYREARRGETYVPMVPSARIVDVARAVAEDTEYPLEVCGVRPGEKLHEILVSEEELPRTSVRGKYVVIGPILPELRAGAAEDARPAFEQEYSSVISPVTYETVLTMLTSQRLTVGSAPSGAVNSQ